MIDHFTDQHAITREAKEIFRPAYRLYSGAFVDIVYDHFLARDEEEFGPGELLAFSKNVYARMDLMTEWFPPVFARIYPYMRSQDWLYHYRELAGIKKSFAGMVSRSAFLEESETAAQLLEQHYQRLQELYRLFWKDLKPFARAGFETILQVNGSSDMP